MVLRIEKQLVAKKCQFWPKLCQIWLNANENQEKYPQYHCKLHKNDWKYVLNIFITVVEGN